MRFLGFILVFGLAACGGGGGGGDAPADDPPRPPPAPTPDPDPSPDPTPDPSPDPSPDPGPDPDPPPPPDPRLARISLYEEQRLRVVGAPGGPAGMDVTAAAALPASGTVTFTGAMTVRIQTDPLTTVLAGDAVVAMPFDPAGRISGDVTAFFGTGSDGVLRDYDGTVTITAGSVGQAGANSWTLDYAGDLTAQTQAITLGGTVTGTFLGNPLAAIAGSAFEAASDVNGTSFETVVTVIGER